MQKSITKSSAQTRKLGENLAGKILRQNAVKKAIVLVLSGNIGTGKTTFLQGFAKGLGIKEKITSPTFVIMKKFKIQNSKFVNFYHLDCYRLNNSEEILDLGFEEVISNPENIVVVEWPENIRKIIPKDAVKIKFTHLWGDKRKVVYF